jgi:adenosyl cobinamide kinase/adenosyl cobinamide phosphate guanylyltransferase
MELYVGGRAQGKTEYVTSTHPGQESRIWDEFHLWVWQELQDGKNPEKDIAEFLEQNPDTIIICDEIGNGIVPMDAFEREYRERLGRILITIAAKADRVERVICGIGQRIK